MPKSLDVDVVVVGSSLVVVCCEPVDEDEVSVSCAPAMDAIGPTIRPATTASSATAEKSPARGIHDPRSRVREPFAENLPLLICTPALLHFARPSGLSHARRGERPRTSESSVESCDWHSES